MKYIIILLVSAATLFSCAELDEEVGQKMEFEKPASVIVDEMVSSYETLKSYADGLVLGANASANDISSSTMSMLLSTNFEQVTPLTELNSNVVLANDGSFDFTAINSYISNASKMGLSVYGNSIISNLNQNDAFLNTIGASLTFLTPLYPNLVDQSPLEDGTFTDWVVNGDVSVEDYMGETSVKMVNDASVSSAEATSLQSPVYAVAQNARFELVFYLLSTQVGEGRVVFSGLNNNEPEMDWTGVDSLSSTFTTKIGWNKIQVQTSDFDGSGEFTFKIELGYTPNVTYFMNIQGLSLINLNGSVDNPEEIFIEAEDGVVGSEWQIDNDDNASGEMYVLANSAENYLTPNNAGSEPFYINYTINAITAGTYTCWVRAWGPTDNDDSFFLSVNGSSFVYNWWSLSSGAWQWTNLGTYTLSVGENLFAACIRENGFKIDRFYFTLTTNVPSGKGSAAIEQSEVTLLVSDDVRKVAVEEFLKDYVINVLDNLGDKINAWTVVNDPFATDGSVAVSGGMGIEGSYYWADHIGADYITQAFATAKANAPDGTKLFLSGTNLNTNSVKLAAITSSITNNSDVDGVALSLDLNLESDLVELGNMFDDLVATGKLIYITDLRVIVSEHTLETYESQSNVYQQVIDLYKSKVPASQQYGISLAEPVSNGSGLWNSDYNRKHSYAGFADGIGGSSL